MTHDPSKVLMGTNLSSDRLASKFLGSPATFVAGLAVRLKDDKTLSVTKADGQWAGISLGRGLSDDLKKTTVLRAGLLVPVLLESAPARGTITITNFANLVSGTDDAIEVAGVSFVAQEGAVTPGGATFRAITDNDTTAESLAAQINAHSTTSPLVVATVVDNVVTVTAKVNTVAGNAYTLTYTDNDTNVGATVSGDGTLEGGGAASDFVVLGEKVYFSDTTGKADDPNSASTISDAVYRSGVLTGIQEDGTEVAAALVDMGGGL